MSIDFDDVRAPNFFTDPVDAVCKYHATEHPTELHVALELSRYTAMMLADDLADLVCNCGGTADDARGTIAEYAVRLNHIMNYACNLTSENPQ